MKIIYNNKELVALVKGTDEYLARYETITIPTNSHLSYNLSFTKGQFGKLPSFIANTSSSQTLKVPYGTSYNISYTADTGYSPPASKSGTVKSTTNIETASGTLKSYTFTITQSANETITVKTNRGTYTSTFTAYYGDTWTASVAVSTGYNAGSLSATSGTVTGNVSVSVGAAISAGPTNVSNYLTFQSTASLSIATANSTKNWDGTLEYSTNLSTWTTWDGTSAISSSSGIIYMIGTGNTQITNEYRWVFTTTGELKCIGNIENLLDYQTVAKGQHPSMSTYCYFYMFSNCTRLIQAPALPATTLANYCYYSMFESCTILTEIHLVSSVQGNSYINDFPGAACHAIVYYDL